MNILTQLLSTRYIYNDPQQTKKLLSKPGVSKIIQICVKKKIQNFYQQKDRKKDRRAYKKNDDLNVELKDKRKYVIIRCKKN